MVEGNREAETKGMVGSFFLCNLVSLEIKKQNGVDEHLVFEVDIVFHHNIKVLDEINLRNTEEIPVDIISWLGD